jgi:hypothetical protein
MDPKEYFPDIYLKDFKTTFGGHMGPDCGWVIGSIFSGQCHTRLKSPKDLFLCTYEFNLINAGFYRYYPASYPAWRVATIPFREGMGCHGWYNNNPESVLRSVASESRRPDSIPIVFTWGDIHAYNQFFFEVYLPWLLQSCDFLNYQQLDELRVAKSEISQIHYRISQIHPSWKDPRQPLMQSRKSAQEKYETLRTEYELLREKHDSLYRGTTTDLSVGMVQQKLMRWHEVLKNYESRRNGPVSPIHRMADKTVKKFVNDLRTMNERVERIQSRIHMHDPSNEFLKSTLVLWKHLLRSCEHYLDEIEMYNRPVVNPRRELTAEVVKDRLLRDDDCSEFMSASRKPPDEDIFASVEM